MEADTTNALAKQLRKCFLPGQHGNALLCLAGTWKSVTIRQESVSNYARAGHAASQCLTKSPTSRLTYAFHEIRMGKCNCRGVNQLVAFRACASVLLNAHEKQSSCTEQGPIYSSAVLRETWCGQPMVSSAALTHLGQSRGLLECCSMLAFLSLWLAFASPESLLLGRLGATPEGLSQRDSAWMPTSFHRALPAFFLVLLGTHPCFLCMVAAPCWSEKC